MRLGNRQHLLEMLSPLQELKPKTWGWGGGGWPCRAVTAAGKALHLRSPMCQPLATPAHSSFNGLKLNQVEKGIPQLH